MLPELQRRYKTVAFRSSTVPGERSTRMSTQSLNIDAEFDVKRHKYVDGGLVLVLGDGYLLFEQ